LWKNIFKTIIKPFEKVIGMIIAKKREGMIMEQKLLELIKNEDKKNPMTDEELSAKLKMRRDEVTELRLKLNIPDSRERRKPYILTEMRKIINQNPSVSDRELTRILNVEGYNVSRTAVTKLRSLIDSEETVKPEKTASPNLDPFSSIIGYDGSLKMQVQQARAAVMYPPHGLHTLIVGPTGVGKSHLAEAMYRFALESGKFQKNAPFIVFNCADYADNPQLLLSQLFGHVKGAFTGADTNKDGLIERANGGILFLDEVHRLPPEGQEILFSILDYGRYRRLGEVDNLRSVDVLIIAATTQDIESSLLLTFRRRIPMVIEMPPLDVRPISERLQIIKSFLAKEATRIGKTLKLKPEPLTAMLLYDCPGNIGQLRSDIQVACAKAFIANLNSKDGDITIGLEDLPAHVRKGMLKKRIKEDQIGILNHELKFTPKDEVIDKLPKEEEYTLPDDIYLYIEDRYAELSNKGLEQNDINEIISGELQVRFQNFSNSFSRGYAINKQDLAQMVGEKMVHTVEEMLKVADAMGYKYKEGLIYCLAIHLAATVSRIKAGKTIVNPQMEKIKKEFEKELAISEEMSKIIEKEYEIHVPLEEIGYIALYLKMMSKNDSYEEPSIAVIIVTHGHVAKAMADVANGLMGVNHAVGIDMPLDRSPEEALEETLAAVKRMDEGKGALLLVDMGSLVTFGEIIMQRTGIPTRTIDRVDTVMAIEAVRKSLLPDITLEDLAESLSEPKHSTRYAKSDPFIVKDKAIVTLCLTGEGSAQTIERFICSSIPDIRDHYEVIPLGLTKEGNIGKIIGDLQRQYEIKAIIGTISPGEDYNIPFISLEEIINGNGIKYLKKILGIKSQDNPLSDLIKKELITIANEETTKASIVDEMVDMLKKHGYVNNDFLLDVYKRELMGATCMEEGCAIPHGLPQNVIKPCISVCVLKKPVKWLEGNEVKVVFLLALKEDNQEAFAALYKK